MTHYVCGFMFNSDYSKVLLIEKQRPAWQKGKWNGIGGHIEAGETPNQAMAREFEEEANIVTAAEDWKEFAILEDENAKVHFFFDRSHAAHREFFTMTDEKVLAWPVIEIFSDWKIGPLLPNIPTLIGHAIGFAYSGFTLKKLMLEE